MLWCQPKWCALQILPGSESILLMYSCIKIYLGLLLLLLLVELLITFFGEKIIEALKPSHMNSRFNLKGSKSETALVK